MQLNSSTLKPLTPPTTFLEEASKGQFHVGELEDVKSPNPAKENLQEEKYLPSRGLTYSEIVFRVSQGILGTPEYIFMQLEPKHFPVLSTLPNAQAAVNIPEDYVLRPDTTGDKITLVFRSNGLISNVRKHLTSDGIYKVAKFLKDNLNLDDEQAVQAAYNLASLDIKGENTTRVLTHMNEVTLRVLLVEKLNLDLDVAYKTAGELLRKDYRDEVISILNGNLEMFQKETYTINYEKEPLLEKIVYRGSEYTLEEFKRDEKEIFKDAYEFLMDFPLVYRGTKSLYRAVTKSEWEDIKGKDMFLIRPGDNFESVPSGQVAVYANSEEYAGVVIKISTKPFFTKRMTTASSTHIQAAYAHFVCGDEIEVSKDGVTFLPLKDFLKL